jgi:ABC-type Fe3+/spermidine/putrescine transport system ATPase subunit
MPEVRLENVSRSFGEVAAVRDVTLTVRDGGFLTLLGPSGCGKTTTLRMIAGLEQNNAGRIAIGDAIVSDAARGRFLQPELRNIGMVFQSYAIWPHMTVFENAAYPLRIRRLGRDAVREKTMTALRMVEMEPYAERPATALSGGQQQRVAIARAIAFEPSVLLLDEPLSNLDAKLREQMRVELRNLQKKLGITTVYVTHDQEEAMALSDEIVIMHGGRIMQIGTPEDVYFRPVSRLVADFCGSPNIFTGTVAEVRTTDNGVRLVKIEGDGWGGWTQSSCAFSPGDRAAVVVRPEAAEVVKRGAPALDAPSLQWDGSVAQDVFRGFRRTLIVRAGDALMTVDSAADRRIPIGEQVTVRIQAERAWALREEKAGGHA